MPLFFDTKYLVFVMILLRGRRQRKMS